MRPRLTELDYAIIAVAPALIMVLIGSLMLFAVGLFYQGPFSLRLNWIVCMFVLGSVSLTRVHIEEGMGRSAFLGAAFGGVMLLAVWTLASDAILLAALLLMAAWWLSTRLVYDCTVLEQSIDASKKGLMQWIRPNKDEEQDERPKASEPKPEPAIEGVTGREEDDRPSTFAEKIDAWLNPTNTKFAPGAWVVYFSLGALPIFGFGQAFASQHSSVSSWYLFTLLVAYVFAALCLLVTTSFLGLRRYLQQRGVVMPLSMTGAWLGVGFGVVALTLIIVAILPRPNAEYDLAKIPFYDDNHERKASKYAQGSEGTKDNRKDRAGTTENQDQADEDSQKSNETRADGKQPGDKTDENAKQSKQGKSDESKNDSDGQSKGDGDKKDESGEGDSESGEKSSEQSDSSDGDSGKQQGENKSGEQNQQGKQGDQKSSDGDKGESSQQESKGEKNAGEEDSGSEGQKQSNESESNSQEEPSGEGEQQEQSSEESSQSESSSSNSFSFNLPGLANLVKLIVYAGVAALIVYLVWKFHEDIAKAWAEFWASLFGRKKKEGEDAEEEGPQPQKPRRRFSSFRNPFQDPAWKKKPAEEWVRYSFAALEAWADEHGHARKEEQTPGEFATMLEQQFDELTGNIRRAADLYGQVAYGSGRAPGETLEVLRKLWQNLTRAA
ncbi:DUF4129 domain-containing protein [Blastopirellula marina]|uniref:Protein-glutamine gamma-glutamyltransferase-like C-terminal domain-containing protein n=1 Tax=Blastopirellula marina TaxID=124 RepID=A0A2S8GCY7_9BACT|nr:DUF4129 domain-containing protein [Blastopirellula marina]PQO42332.1 hypothetical protein C5Y93_28770 [Blastopirellula marina]